MNLDPVQILLICVGVAVPLVVWLIWRAVSRVLSSKVPMWEKVVGISGIIAGAFVAALQWPVIGGVVAIFGLIVLVGPTGGAAAGGAIGGAGSGSGCGGGGGGGC